MQTTSNLSAVTGKTPGESANVVIKAEGLYKEYTLFPSPTAQLSNMLGLHRLRMRKKAQFPKHTALKSVDLTIREGEKVGIIGRNGAGKTTLLKLISQNTTPSGGLLDVQGNVQALMQVGLGFHPEFTGRANIGAALIYQNYSPAERAVVEADIIDFCELGDFIDQPLKTYSLGMQARIQFACATAIKPEILIVDEILGAGDAYFSVKSSKRMEKLTQTGCTLLLVSHSMTQVLQFCDRCIWIDNGIVLRDGPAKEVIVEYEAYMYKLSKGLDPDESEGGKNAEHDMPDWYVETVAKHMEASEPEETTTDAPESETSWLNDDRIRITASLLDSNNIPRMAFSNTDMFRFALTITATQEGTYDCWFVITIYTQDGKPLCRHVSPKQVYDLEKDEKRTVFLSYDDILLGKGEYHATIGVFRDWKPAERSGANWYELLNRSIEFFISTDSDYDPSVFAHPARWELQDEEA